MLARVAARWSTPAALERICDRLARVGWPAMADVESTTQVQPWGIGMTVVTVLAVAEGVFATANGTSTYAWLDGIFGGTIVFVVGYAVVMGYRFIRRRRVSPDHSAEIARIPDEAVPYSGVELSLRRYAALRELAALREDGVLSENEFLSEKSRLLMSDDPSNERTDGTWNGDGPTPKVSWAESRQIMPEQVALRDARRVRGR